MYICILVYDYRFYFVVRIKTISLIIMCPEVDFFFAHSACVLNGALLPSATASHLYQEFVSDWAL